MNLKYFAVRILYLNLYKHHQFAADIPPNSRMTYPEALQGMGTLGPLGPDRPRVWIKHKKIPPWQYEVLWGPITAYSNKFNVTWRNVTWRNATLLTSCRVPWLNKLETFGFYGLYIMDLTVAEQFYLLKKKIQNKKKKNSFFTKNRHLGSVRKFQTIWKSMKF